MPAVPAVTPNLGLPRFAADSTSEIWVHLNMVSDLLDAIAGPWQSYAPVWSQSNGQTLSIGDDGELTGRYWTFGKSVFGRVWLQRGGDSWVGSGGNYWIFTLPPIAPRNWQTIGGGFSGMRNGVYLGGSTFPVTSTAIGAVAGDLGRISNTVPGTTHSPTDWYSMLFTYERA